MMKNRMESVVVAGVVGVVCASIIVIASAIARDHRHLVGWVGHAPRVMTL